MKAFRILLLSVVTFTGLAVAPQLADAGYWDRRARTTYRHVYRPHYGHHHHQHHHYRYRPSYRWYNHGHWGHHHHHHHRHGGIGIYW